MEIDRSRADTSRLSALSLEIAGLNGPCVGCENCDGLCMALIDALVLPDVILTKKRESS